MPLFLASPSDGGVREVSLHGSPDRFSPRARKTVSMNGLVRGEKPIRAAKNKALFREVNARITELGDAVPFDGLNVVCECTNLGCAAVVPMSSAEYQRSRRRPHRFVVKPGHVLENVERVVQATDRYEIVARFASAETRVKAHVRSATHHLRDASLRVKVELSGPAFRTEWRHLGSLAERHGMRMSLERPISESDDRALISLTAPRATTTTEAEHAVARLLELVRIRDAPATAPLSSVTHTQTRTDPIRLHSK